ncbi:MAG: uroporphyrinogen-III synthase [Alphaproteobacteria bacterium]|nr:uroporphyrinogen-III synthase [Alphaproteobacteria bacterium]MBL6931556.1 uroporphyrinogen-III synthase [Rhodospirillales bacterium]
MRLIITRPHEDAEPLASALATLGIETAIEPLLSIEITNSPEPDLSDVQALLLTSANGVRAFAQISRVRNVPVFAVGDASARAAVDAGFERVESASGNVDDLAELIGQKLKPESGALLHIAGSKVAGDLAGYLGEGGYDYRRLQLYHAAKATALTTECVNAIKNRTVDGVVMYSPRTAENFVDLLRHAGVADCSAHLTAFCLSAAVAAKLEALAWSRVIVAETPDQAALIKSVQESF